MIRLIYLITLFVFVPIQVLAAYQTLEIISPKTSGTGSPAILSTHRIFFAYPGIEYKIRAQVIGGDYPYSYQLTNAPSDMTVDASGYIRWGNPQSSASNIGLRVTDSNNAYVNTEWSINVQTAGFKFVDIAQGTNGDGTLANPYNSISNMVAGANSADIIYFRTGTYPVPVRGSYPIGNADAFCWDSPSDTATRWIAFPGENPVIDLIGDRFFYSSTSIPFYFEGLTFTNGREYFFRTQGQRNYVTFLDNTFDGLTLERPNYNSNQGTYFADTDPLNNPTAGWYITFQGNTFKNYIEAQAIGSFYFQSKLLIENNFVTDFSGASLNITQAVALKVGIQYLTFRGNNIYLNDPTFSGLMGGSPNGYFSTEESTDPDYTSHSLEICFNRFYSPSGEIRFNHAGGIGSTRPQLETWFYRNTVESRLSMNNMDYPDTCGGPWDINSNVIQNSISGLTQHDTSSEDWMSCISYVNNVAGTSGLVDASGLLTQSYSAFLGVTGWQFSDASTPMDGSYAPGSPGVCGTAHGVPVIDICPSTGLCTTGVPSLVANGIDSCNWTCTDESAASCSAPYSATIGGTGSAAYSVSARAGHSVTKFAGYLAD